MHRAQLRGSPLSTEQHRPQDNSVTRPNGGLPGPQLTRLPTAPNTTAQSPSIPAMAPGMRLPPCALLLWILSPSKLTLLCSSPHWRLLSHTSLFLGLLDTLTILVRGP